MTITKSGEVQFLLMLHSRFDNATQVFLCKSHPWKWENMKSEPNNIHIPLSCTAIEAWWEIELIALNAYNKWVGWKSCHVQAKTRATYTYWCVKHAISREGASVMWREGDWLITTCAILIRSMQQRISILFSSEASYIFHLTHMICSCGWKGNKVKYIHIYDILWCNSPSY